QNDLFLSLAYNAADVFVIPSVQEAFGLTALEAAACGTPSIGFNTGGIPDLIEDGETGYLVPLRDVSSLQERLLQFIDNPAGRARMRFNSRARAKSLFSFNRQAEEYRSLYAEMRTKSSAAQ
ncbi:MAG TPA: glycosyltransferase, partial [Candidatus Acidoferrum sp.]|nr:glycosyltransferase [Candidatus Acidoferrum sp.]